MVDWDLRSLLESRPAERRELLESLRSTYNLPAVTRDARVVSAQRFAVSLLHLAGDATDGLDIDTVAEHAQASYILEALEKAIQMAESGNIFSQRAYTSIFHMLAFLKRSSLTSASLAGILARVEGFLSQRFSRDDYKLQCPYCEAEFLVGCTTCPRGHGQEYCCITQLLITHPSYRHCITCGSVALRRSDVVNDEFSWLPVDESGSSACVICGHELTQSLLLRSMPK